MKLLRLFSTYFIAAQVLVAVFFFLLWLLKKIIHYSALLRQTRLSDYEITEIQPVQVQGYENVKQPQHSVPAPSSSYRCIISSCVTGTRTAAAASLYSRAAPVSPWVHNNYSRQVPQRHWCVALHGYYSADKSQPYAPIFSLSNM